jgi:hypothetical protein
MSVPFKHATVLLPLLFVLLRVPLFAQEQMVFGDPREIESELRIRQVLQIPVSLNLREAPLSDAIANIEHQIGQSIWIDSRALEDAGVGLDTPISYNCTSLPARDALYQLLTPVDLTRTNHDGLVITTPEKASSELVTRVYPVADLVMVPGDDHTRVLFDYDSLIEVITSVVLPTTWDEVGGPGSIAPFASTGTLVLSQTRDAHEGVESLLRSIRAARDWQGIPTPDVNLPWRELFSAQVERQQYWRQQNLNYADPAAPINDPAQVEAWQRPRLHE